MFGYGVFGELAFAESESPSGIYNVSVTEAGSAVDAISSLAIFASSVLETAAAIDAPSSLAIFQTSIMETGSPTDTQSGLAVYPNSLADVLAAMDTQAGPVARTGAFDLSAEATLEFVGTTKFIDMIEEGEADIGIAAEIRTRSL